jgi:predicted phosphodiesterase
MHIAVFADVHANLTALRMVLRDIEAHRPVDLVVSNGDQIFGGPRPLETWHELEQASIYCLLGNTERDIGCGKFSPEPAGGERREQILEVFDWTMEALPVDVRSAAAQLPERLDVRVDGGPLLTVSHANAVNVDDFIWADTDQAELERLIGKPSPQLLVVGHIHAPLDLQVGSTQVFRPGSVGLKYEPSAYNVAHWTEISWDGSRRTWTAERHELGWDHRAEIEAGRQADYPGTNILPGYDRA